MCVTCVVCSVCIHVCVSVPRLNCMTLYHSYDFYCSKDVCAVFITKKDRPKMCVGGKGQR